MIYLGLGANLARADGTTPEATLRQAVAALAEVGLQVAQTSRLWSSAPVLDEACQGEHPRYVNAVVAVQDLQELREAGEKESALALLARLHKLEQQFERVRDGADLESSVAPRTLPRTLDLDILDWHGLVLDCPQLVLPHPNMHRRAFVLAPLGEIAPLWQHPQSAKTARQLLAGLEGQDLFPLP